MRKIKKLTIRIFIALIALSLLAVPVLYLIILNSPAVSATWYDDSWGYRKRIDTTIVSNSSDLSNLQMLLTIDTSTGASGIGSGKMQSSCQDLRFTNTNGKILPYYIDSGCSTTTTKIWVMVDLVPKNTTSMTLFMYYGNPSAPVGSNPQPYFDNVVGLVGYWNMNENSWTNDCSTETVKDLSVNGDHGQSCPNSTGPTGGVSGQYGNAGSFDGSNDYAKTSSNLDLSGTNVITVEFWLNWTAYAADDKLAMEQNQGTTTQFFIDPDSLNTCANKVEAELNGDVGTNVACFDRPSTGNWHHYAIVYNKGAAANSEITPYVDGNAVSYTKPLGGSNNNTNNFGSGILYFMSRNGTSLFGAGQLDDVKIYNTARSATQILNDYNNKLPNGQTLTIASTAPTTVVPTSPTYNTEEKAPSPIAYWKFNDGQGQTAQDSTTTNADGTLAGTTVPTWQTEDQCISGKCLYFDGLTSKVTVSKVLPGIQTVSMWVKPNTSVSTALIDLDGGTHKITTDASSVISATGFDTPTIYVNGKVSSTLTANSWNYVTITTATSFASTSSLTIGLTGSTYFKGFIDEVKIYPYARSAAQILTDYNSRSNNEGASDNTAGGVIASGAKQSSLSDGLVGYWKMDESSWTNDCSTTTVIDSSGNGNNGTSCPNAGGTQPTAGKFGNGGSFDGSNDYVNVSNSSTLNSTSAFTVSSWFKFVSPLTDGGGGGGTYAGIIGKGGTWSSNTNYVLGLRDGIGTAFLYTRNGGTLDGRESPTGLSDDGNWHLLLGTYDGSNYKIYLDGTLIGTDPVGVGPGTTSEDVSIGRDSGDSYFHGSLDETRIYNRALSPSEVSALYNFAPGPKVYLKMDEGTGTSANDSSGNGRTGTINGNPLWSTGKYGKGLKMDGTGDNIQVSDF